MIVPSIKANKQKETFRFIKEMGKVMSEDKSHQDGLGYAAVDSNGNLFGERWLNNHDAFKKRHSGSAIDNELENKYLGFLVGKEQTYNSFGEVNLSDIRSVTLHTRLATSAKGLINTHPFVDKDTSVIHNGIISNHSMFKKTLSTCDSEAILTQYIHNAVSMDIMNTQFMVDELQGYFACGVYSRDENGDRILDIFKSETADLIAAFIKEIDTIVFASRLDQLEKACKTLNFKIVSTFDVVPSSIVRINPLNGDVLGIEFFDDSSYYNDYKNSKDIIVKGDNSTMAEMIEQIRSGEKILSDEEIEELEYNHRWERDMYLNGDYKQTNDYAKKA